jgi:REP element-mobilizing transposase RayT
MEKLKSTVGFIHFICVLDNNGKRIYSRYFSQNGSYLADISAQKDFEKKIGHAVLNLNVNRNNEGILFLIKIIFF